MKKYITFTIVFWNLFLINAIAQSKHPISFAYMDAKSNDSDTIKLSIRNLSKDKTFFYSISVSGLTDTGWVVLNSDINSIGQNDFLVLKPLKPNKKYIKSISKKKIFFIYAYYRPQKIRFSLMYYEKQDFESEGGIIELPPLKK